MALGEPMHRDRDRAESFGSIAEQYDRARPSYPDALVLDLLMRDPHDVLDVGCGTGKAARLFAERGLHVLGIEVDAAMAAVARAHGIEVEVSAFEGWDDRGRRFDLLVCGQAWHWIDPARGAVKAVEVLRPSATIALFWNLDDTDPALQGAFDEVYRRLAPHLLEQRRRHGGRTENRDSVLDALEAAGFTDVDTRDYPWQRRYGRDEWLALLATHSDHHLLPDDQRNRVLDAIGDAIDRLGGSVTAQYATQTVTARAPS